MSVITFKICSVLNIPNGIFNNPSRYALAFEPESSVFAFISFNLIIAFSLTVLDESCLALFKEDYYQAEKTIKKIEEISKYEKKVRDSSKSLKDDEEIYRVRRLSENIRRISEYASDIAEIVLNMNIEKTLKKME